MERPATPEGKASPRAGVEARVCEREPRKSNGGTGLETATSDCAKTAIPLAIPPRLNGH